MPEVRQIVVPPNMWGAIELWLGALGFVLVNMDDALSGEDLPTYTIMPMGAAHAP
jgi:hypothetical protein